LKNFRLISSRLRRFKNFVESVFVVEETFDDDNLNQAAEDEQDEVDGGPECHPTSDGLGIVKIFSLHCRNLKEQV
jgi:hypothetical protein